MLPQLKVDRFSKNLLVITNGPVFNLKNDVAAFLITREFKVRAFFISLGAFKPVDLIKLLAFALSPFSC